MRIISGSFKGKKILEPKDKKTRPLKDLVKESIFNILKHSKKFEIDLFSGVGSFGIECLSIGVKKVIFIENYQEVLPILKKNLSSLKSIQNYEVLENNIYEENIFSNLNDKFDIIFLDPPYKDKNLESLLNKIKHRRIINKNGIIILHRHKNEPDKFPASLKLIEQKVYGISKIIFLSCLS